MKIVHLTVVRQLTPGQSRQLKFEYDAAQQLKDVSWSTIAFHNGPVTEPYMSNLPPFFRGVFTRKLFGWLIVLKLSRTHDIVMLRHMTFDPFAFIFAPFVRNRVSVHHAKEVEELRLVRKGWKGKAASGFERFSGRVNAMNARMILGVTKEIAEYERDMYAPSTPIGVYPNGIDVEQVALLGDKRRKNEISAGFMCGAFSHWHGLDKLIDAVDSYQPCEGDPPITIHLIGTLSSDQKRDIISTKARRKVFKAHGLKTESQYRPILARCDFGITSLALERKGLVEASTLKVREMLALGLPVYSGHEDVALPSTEEFVKLSRKPNIREIIAFASTAKKLSRAQVRACSLSRINKLDSMISTAAKMSDVAV